MPTVYNFKHCRNFIHVFTEACFIVNAAVSKFTGANTQIFPLMLFTKCHELQRDTVSALKIKGF